MSVCVCVGTNPPNTRDGPLEKNLELERSSWGKREHVILSLYTSATTTHPIDVRGLGVGTHEAVDDPVHRGELRGFGFGTGGEIKGLEDIDTRSTIQTFNSTHYSCHFDGA